MKVYKIEKDKATLIEMRYPVICSKGHPMIIHGELDCPLCGAIAERSEEDAIIEDALEEKDERIEELEDEVESLEQENEILQRKIESLESDIV